MNVVQSLGFGLLQAAALLALAPLLRGGIKKMKAAFQNRQGPPLLQCYFDLAKLLRKEPVRSDVSSWVFVAGPRVYFATAVAAFSSEGPEVSTIRRRESALASWYTTSTKDVRGQRRNGFPALTCTTISEFRGETPAAARRRSTDAAATGSSGISVASISGSGGPIPSGRRMSHCVTTECRGRSARGRGTRVVYIQLRPATS